MFLVTLRQLSIKTLLFIGDTILSESYTTSQSYPNPPLPCQCSCVTGTHDASCKGAEVAEYLFPCPGLSPHWLDGSIFSWCKSEWTQIGGSKPGREKGYWQNSSSFFLPSTHFCSTLPHSTHHLHPELALGLSQRLLVPPLTVCGSSRQAAVYGVLHFATAIKCTAPLEHEFCQHGRSIGLDRLVEKLKIILHLINGLPYHGMAIIFGGGFEVAVLPMLQCYLS